MADLGYFSKTYRVGFFSDRILNDGDTVNVDVTAIVNDYYGDSGLNKYFLQLAIVSLNAHAFRNRNFMFRKHVFFGSPPQPIWDT